MQRRRIHRRSTSLGTSFEIDMNPAYNNMELSFEGFMVSTWLEAFEEGDHLDFWVMTHLLAQMKATKDIDYHVEVTERDTYKKNRRRALKIPQMAIVVQPYLSDLEYADMLTLLPSWATSRRLSLLSMG